MDQDNKRLCGAKNRQGEPCKKPPMKGKTRCAAHGGKSKGGKASKRFSHGIYSSVLTAEELAMQDFLSTKLSSVDDEINLVRIRLLRAQRAEEQDRLNASLQIEEVKTVTGGDFANTTTTSRKTDWPAIINTLMGRLGSLMKLRMELLIGKGDGEFSGIPADETDDKARRIKEALAAMDGAVTDIEDSPN